MSYASPADVRARAGVLAPAFDAGSVTDAQLTQYLTDAAAEIDARIAEHGFPIPVTDATAVAALKSLNAIGALATALQAKFPGTGSQDDPGKALARAQKLWDDAMGADGTMQQGTYPAVAYLLSTSASPLPTDFFIENPDYGMPGSAYLDPQQVNPYFAPTIARTDKF